MKNKKEISLLLNQTPNISATKKEIEEFLLSKYFNKNEENEGNIIEDFITWRGEFDSIEEARQHYENYK
jgi:hypothetical protein